MRAPGRRGAGLALLEGKGFADALPRSVIGKKPTTAIAATSSAPADALLRVARPGCWLGRAYRGASVILSTAGAVVGGTGRNQAATSSTKRRVNPLK